MKAAIYSRKSVFTGKGESIENQVQMCTQYAKNNLNIDEFIIYEDEGFSGGNINRPKFKELISDIKKKEFKVLICYRLDRISRNVADFSSTLALLEENNINFVSIKEQFDTSTPMGKAMVYIASVFAQLERETIAERIRDNMFELSKTGRWLGGQTPLGFNSEKITYLDTELKERSYNKLSPIDSELKIVNIIYSKYLETKSINKTLKYLLSSNIKGKNGGAFASISINDILRNPVYVKSNESVFNYLKNKEIHVCGIPNGHGILTYNKKNSKYKTKNKKEWIAAVSNHDGIISAHHWLQAQNLLDENSNKSTPRIGTSKKALLSGILKCALCGSPMRVCYGKPRKDGSKNYYYTCTLKAHSGKKKCTNPNVRGDYLEDVIISYLKGVNINFLINFLKHHKKDIKNKTTYLSLEHTIDSDIKTKEKELNTLITNLSKIQNPTASKYILKKIDDIGNTIEKLKLNTAETLYNQKNTLNNLNTDLLIKSFNNFKDFFNILEKFNKSNYIIELKRDLIKNTIKKVTFDGYTDEIIISFLGS